MRKVLIGVLVLAAVGAAYYLGTKSNATPPAVAVEKPDLSPSLVDNLIVPTGLTMPAKLDELKFDKPSKMLAGEVMIPNDLLRKEPPATGPNFVVPSLSK